MRTPGNRRSVVLSTVLDEGCHAFFLLSTGFLHRSSALSQEKVAQSGMEMGRGMGSPIPSLQEGAWTREGPKFVDGGPLMSSFWNHERTWLRLAGWLVLGRVNQCCVVDRPQRHPPLGDLG